MATAQFSIQLAYPAEGPILAKITRDSFLNDRHTQMKGLGKDPYNLEKSMTAYLSQQAVSPRTVLLKAVDNETGDIAGWVLWAFRGFAVKETAEIRDAVPHAATQFTSSPAQTTDKTTPKDQIKQVDIDDNDTIKQLERMTDADMKSWMTKLMPDGTKCMYVSSLCVAPKWQSRGVGSMLLQWGTQTADAAGVFIWVHSSASAWEMYAKYGFKVVGTLDVDLDQYAPAPAPDNDGKWGQYVFRYMKREPCKG
ncbi:Acyl-CoA N-acyltransferase [Penicillium griseofulvum]|uniref:Acyl-CoA N-acyltransferase n=1 Tax=Penicillium patulum TaxID=5078 RepID=A0A135LBP4_PENPA|nr:Acyl-CoA N-acyltransferase [Penicillium griseofulvum]KXG46290.1 Acyl-CoA N-acyltransferase [Penicillium griseofulvum]